jgi:preprotein translocase subunit YajC
MNQKIIIMQQSEASFLDIFLSQLPIFLIFLVLYYFILRPNSKKQESVKLMQENLAKGDRVVTIGGIHGKVTAVKSETEMTVDKVAIAKVKNSSK